MIKTKKQMFTIIGVFTLVMLLGTVTYAFFNYTRTGSANNIRTGRIYFNADGGNNTVTLSNLFPISLGENESVTSSTPGVGSLVLHITGDTEYTEGVEYLIEAVDVTGNGQTALPISIDISYTPTEVASGEDANVIGTNDEDYFTNRGGNTSRYKLLSTGTISEGEDILVGYIAPGATGIDGELTILAYLDADNIAITDTYPGGTKREVVANYSTSACETALTGDATAVALCADADDLQEALDNSDLTNTQITALLNAGVITEYTDETSTTWVDGRTVFTTEEWNALQATGVSFKIKATAQEGIWVEDPAAGTIDSCLGCKFIYTTNEYYFSATNSNSQPLSTLTTFANNNDTLVDDYRTLNKNHFLGFKFDGNGNITNAYACGIKGEDPNQGTVFCIEGAVQDSFGGNSTTRTAIYDANMDILNPLYGSYDSGTGLGCHNVGYVLTGSKCEGSLVASTLFGSGAASTQDGNDVCSATNVGYASCYTY